MDGNYVAPELIDDAVAGMRDKFARAGNGSRAPHQWEAGDAINRFFEAPHHPIGRDDVRFRNDIPDLPAVTFGIGRPLNLHAASPDFSLMRSARQRSNSALASSRDRTFPAWTDCIDFSTLRRTKSS